MNRFTLIGAVAETPVIKKEGKKEYIEFVIRVQRDFNEEEFDIISCVLPIHFQSIIERFQKNTIVGVKGRIQSSNNEDKFYDLIIEKIKAVIGDE